MTRPTAARTRSIGLGAAIVLACVTQSACASVPAWERETLSRREMADEPDPEWAAIRRHIAGARESALDPVAAGGGGCGCN